MIRDRITEYPVQSYGDKEGLPAPLNQSFKFHVKNGLVVYGDRVRLKEEDGGFYRIIEKKRGWGHVSYDDEFEGLIRRGEDIDALVKKIESTYEAFKQPLDIPNSAPRKPRSK